MCVCVCVCVCVCFLCIRVSLTVVLCCFLLAFCLLCLSEPVCGSHPPLERLLSLLAGRLTMKQPTQTPNYLWRGNLGWCTQCDSPWCRTEKRKLGTEDTWLSYVVLTWLYQIVLSIVEICLRYLTYVVAWSPDEKGNGKRSSGDPQPSHTTQHNIKDL